MYIYDFLQSGGRLLFILSIRTEDILITLCIPNTRRIHQSK